MFGGMASRCSAARQNTNFRQKTLSQFCTGVRSGPSKSLLDLKCASLHIVTAAVFPNFTVQECKAAQRFWPIKTCLVRVVKQLRAGVVGRGRRITLFGDIHNVIP
eukprot:793088-Pelagomonas_calceolata.AAC.3